MDWDKLRIFHAVAEAGSFTHAGDVLNLSQSAVSRQISTLEESLGVSLFHRHARGLILTEEGELLSKTAKEIFGRLSMIEGLLQDSKEKPEGPLRITTTEFIGSTWLGPNLSIFNSQHPNLQLTLLLDDKILNLNMREADAAIRLHKPEQPDLIQRQLATLNFHIYASDTYLAQYGTPKNAKDLRSHQLIGFPEGTTAPFSDQNWLLRLADANPDHDYNMLRMNSLFGIYQAVAHGAGLAALPDYLAQQDTRLKVVLPDLTPPSVNMYFVYPEERRRSTRLAIFRDFLINLVNQTKF